jgi:hypothetical protein
MSKLHIQDDGTIIEETVQFVDDILDLNKMDYNSVSDYRPYAGSDMKLVARVPLAVALAWEKEGVGLIKGKIDEKKLRQKLNDSENRYLRTIPGKL